MSNAEGSYRTTTENMMKAFDKLPPEIRQALANSNENWVPQPILSIYRRKCERNFPSDAVKYCLDMLKRWNADSTEEHWYRMRRLEANGTEYNTPIRRTAVKKQARKEH